MDLTLDRERFDHKNEERPDSYRYRAVPGLTEELIREISTQKHEPEWMLQKRLQGLRLFNQKATPTWGPDLSELDIEKITLFLRPNAKKNARSWDDVPPDIKTTFEKLGIPEAERNALSGVGAQYESEVIYHNLKKEWEEQGVIFLDMDEAVHKHPDLVRRYFMTSCVPVGDHKFAALHAAVWSGGTFLHVPKGVHVSTPLQAYFRMNAAKMGQFEHTLIVVEDGASVHYIEGCSAPQYGEHSLHAGCVEIHVKKNARARYSSVENWSKNTYNLNTKRAIVEENGIIEWVNGNLGCLTEDTIIFTNPKGPITIKTVMSGDSIYSWDAKTNSIQKAKVLTKIFSGNKSVFKVKAGGREIEASANHPFLTLIRKKNHLSHKKGFFHQEWKPLSELKKGDLIAIAKKLPITSTPYQLPCINTIKIVNSKNQYANFRMDTSHLYNRTLKTPKETTKDFMWLLGLLLGDGHIDSKQNKINIATHEAEDYRDELCRILKRLFNYTVTEKKQRYIIINSKVLCQLFKNIGVGGTAATKEIPKWVFGLPEEQILAFMAGYFDADGHCARNALAFTSISKVLLEQLRLLAIQTGFGVSNIFVHGKPGKVKIVGRACVAKGSWRLLFNGKKIRELPVKCVRKKEKIVALKTKRQNCSAQGLNFKSKVTDEIGYATIQSIECQGVKPTFDIEVENYHNFVANGVIVHNSHTTMLYPCSILKGEGARADFLGIAFAGKGQHQDTGAKVVHLAPHTSSTIISKSISKDGGITSYRGLLKITKGAVGSKASVQCDALMVDAESQSNTYPVITVSEEHATVAHEATAGKIGQDELFYLQSRGITEEQAKQMIVSGFIEPIVKELPLEYAVELNRLIELEMEGSLG